MDLSAEWFQDLATEMNGASSIEPGKERRRSNRVELRSRVPLSMIVKGERRPAVPILVRDFSPRGIKILYPEPMKGGQQFVIQLKGSHMSVNMLCTALHCRRLANGLHSVGAEFTCTLSDRAPETAKVDAKTQERIRASMLD